MEKSIQRTEVRNPYTPRRRVGIDFKNSPSMTKQEFKKECDIKTIMAKYQRTGLLEHVNQYQGQYADLGDPCDFQTAQNIMIEAQAAFDSLPSSMRKRFGNNPHEFLEFVHDERNRKEMIEMGLIKPKAITSEPPQKAVEEPKPPKGEPPAKPSGKTPGEGA